MKLKFFQTLIFCTFLAVSCNHKTGTHLEKADNYRTYDPAVQKFLLAVRSVEGTGEINSIMVVKNDKKVLEYYDCCYGPDFMNICWSVSKTFTATALGFAVQDGLISINDKLIDHLKPEQLPKNISDTLANLTVYDLLRMSSGLKKDPIGPTGAYDCDTTTLKVLDAGFSFAPGERYKYNSHNTYLISVAVQNVTGKTVADYLDGKLFKPLGISKYHWDTSLEGYSMGGWGLYMSTESLAKAGLFFLHKGVWNGKRLLNEEWFDEAMKPQIYQCENQGLSEEQIAGEHPDWKAGYGYQMRVNACGGARFDGAHGQWVFVRPQDNAVIVVTGNVQNTRKEMDAVHEFIDPLITEN